MLEKNQTGYGLAYYNPQRASEMNDSLQLLYIPEWIFNVAKRHDLDLLSLFKYENFNQYLSYDDQISLFSCNAMMERLLGAFYADDCGGIIFDENGYIETDGGGRPESTSFPDDYILNRLYITRVGADLNNPDEFESYVDNKHKIESLCMSDEYCNTIHSRLFSASAYAVENSGSLMPQVVDVDRNVVALILKPGQIVINNLEMLGNKKGAQTCIGEGSIHFLTRAMEAVLKQFYVYSAQSLVHSSPWFVFYTNLLAKQTAILY